MLDVYTHQQEVVVTGVLPTVKGAEIVPVTVEYEITDENGSEIQARTALVGYTSGAPVIEIDAPLNTLTDTDRALRVVTIWMTTASGDTFTDRQRYVIQTFDVLKPFGNSFQTLDQALLTAAAIVDLPGWEEASDNQRISAMIEAHERVCRLNLRYKEDPAFKSQAMLNERSWTYISNARLIEADDWASFPAAFKNALMRAQVIEADILLSGDPIRDKRLQGIVSETIGEAKMFFNNRPPIQLPVSKRTLEVLGGYFHFITSVGRG